LEKRVSGINMGGDPPLVFSRKEKKRGKRRGGGGLNIMSPSPDMEDPKAVGEKKAFSPKKNGTKEDSNPFTCS